MDVTITAPVVLQYGQFGFEEEPIRAEVSARTVEEAVREFQNQAYEMLVETGTCDAVDFYPYEEFADEYTIIEA